MTIETKFNPKEVVWIMINNKPKECVIFEVKPGIRTERFVSRDTYTIEGYDGHSPSFYDDQMFKTKQLLIENL